MSLSLNAQRVVAVVILVAIATAILVAVLSHPSPSHSKVIEAEHDAPKIVQASSGGRAELVEGERHAPTAERIAVEVGPIRVEREEFSPRLMEGTLLDRSGRGIVGGIITVMHPRRYRDPAKFQAETKQGGEFSLVIPAGVFPEGFAYVQACGRFSAMFEGFVRIGKGICIFADVDESDDLWLLSGVVSLDWEEPQWLVEVVGRQEQDSFATILASSMFWAPYTESSSRVQMRFLDLAYTEWSHPVYLCVSQPGRKMLSETMFASLGELRSAMDGGLRVAALLRRLSLPLIDGEPPSVVIVTNYHTYFGKKSATMIEGDWQVRLSPGRYQVKALTVGRRLAEAVVSIDESLGRVAVGEWDSISPGPYNLVVDLVDNNGLPVEGATVSIRRSAATSSARSPFGVSVSALPQSGRSIVKGLSEGRYTVSAVSRSQNLDGELTCEVPATGGSVSITLDSHCDVVVTVKSLGSGDVVASAGGDLMWKSVGSDKWVLQAQKAGAANSGWVVTRAPCDTPISIVARGRVGGGLLWVGSAHLTTPRVGTGRAVLEVQLVEELRGRCVDEAGEPIAGLAVECRSTPEVPSNWGSFVTGRDGSYRLLKGLEGEAMLRVANGRGEIVFTGAAHGEEEEGVLIIPRMKVLPDRSGK